jgi:hypothetical protein
MPLIIEASRLKLPTVVALGCPDGTDSHRATQQCRQLIEQLAPHVTLFSLATLPLAASDGWDAHGWKTHVEEVVEAGAHGFNAANVVAVYSR